MDNQSTRGQILIEFMLLLLFLSTATLFLNSSDVSLFKPKGTFNYSAEGSLHVDK